jgi:predicted metal-dependent hydrolase
MPQIQLGNRSIPYILRYSGRARHVSFKIDAKQGLQVILPPGYPTEGLDGLLKERQSWILKHLPRYERVQAAEHQYISGEKLPFLGEEYELEVIPTQSGKQTTVARQAKFIRVRLQGAVLPTEQSEIVRAALEAWYRAQAKSYLTQRARELATAHGFEFENLAIKGQRTRWGSCSSKKNLNFNWRLMMAPPAAVDYVIIHELCHLKEMNHSPRFWALVAGLCPNYAYWIRWFKEHSPQLYL